MSHRPKTAALIAYAEALLSPEGQRRVEAHLAGCEACRAELAAIEAYDALVEDVRSVEIPTIDFASMELPLAREAEAVSRQMIAQRQRRSARPWIAAGLVAAAAAAALWWSTHETEPQAPPRAEAPVEREAPAPVIAPEPARLTPVVTLAAGEVRRETADGEIPLELGAVLDEGARVGTGAASELHVRLADGTGFRLAASSALALARAREDEIRLELAQGSVGHAVAPLSNGAAFVVLAAGYSVEVTGTRFVVSALDGTVGVDLSEGAVRIRPPRGEPIELEAPARWRSSGGAEGGAPRPVSVRGLEAPRVAPTPVRLADARMIRWSVDGIEIETSGDVQLGLAPGEHPVRAWDTRGRLHTALLPVGGAPVELSAGALQADAPRVRAGHLDEADLRPVLSRGMRQVQRCYELALRQGTGAVTGRARLRIEIGLTGGVQRAQVLGIPESSLTECITSYASRWTFPPPGGPLTVEQPLTLAPTQ